MPDVKTVTPPVKAPTPEPTLAAAMVDPIKVGDTVVLLGKVTNIDAGKKTAWVQHASGQGSAYEFPLKELKKA
jgi:hypothetical protein